MALGVQANVPNAPGGRPDPTVDPVVGCEIKVSVNAGRASVWSVQPALPDGLHIVECLGVEADASMVALYRVAAHAILDGDDDPDGDELLTVAVASLVETGIYPGDSTEHRLAKSLTNAPIGPRCPGTPGGGGGAA